MIITSIGPADHQEEESEPERKPAKKPSGDVKSNGKAKSPVKTRKEPPTGGRVLPGKTRGGKREQVEQTTGEKIKANQQRLHQQRQQDGLAKWESGDGGKANGADKAVKRYESYRREEQLPREIEQRRVHRDFLIGMVLTLDLCGRATSNGYSSYLRIRCSVSHLDDQKRHQSRGERPDLAAYQLPISRSNRRKEGRYGEIYNIS